ncbi:hypothetical protein LINPERPRIM_LOCUS36282 [Linum perenne]
MRRKQVANPSRQGRVSLMLRVQWSMESLLLRNGSAALEVQLRKYDKLMRIYKGKKALLCGGCYKKMIEESCRAVDASSLNLLLVLSSFSFWCL